MNLTNFHIENFNVINESTGLTPFQESIATNNKSMFFAFMHSGLGLKIDINQYVKEQYSLLEYSYINASLHNDFTIFEFLLNKPDILHDNVCDEIKLILAIQKGDNNIVEDILSSPEFREPFYKTEKRLEEHPLFNIIRYASTNPDLFDIYKKYELPILSSEKDAFFFFYLFNQTTSDNVHNTEKILQYLIKDLNLNPCHSFKSENIRLHCGLFSFIYEYINCKDFYLPTNLFKILNTSPYFDINLCETSYGPDFHNLLYYAYLYTDFDDKTDPKKIILELVKNHKDLNMGYNEDSCYSPIILAILYNDIDFFDKCLHHIDYTYKDSQGNNLLVNLLKKDYDIDFYYKIGYSQDLFLQFVEHIIEQLYKNNIDITISLPEAASCFNKKMEEHAREHFTQEDIILPIVAQVYRICEKALLVDMFHKKQNHEEYNNKKRL